MSKKILVVYESRYGSTKKYAEWIAQALESDLEISKKVNSTTLKQYDVIIYGGGLYAGGIAGVKLVTNSPCKNRIVFTVGLADPNTTDYSGIIEKNFTPELIENTKFFHFRGGIEYKKLGFVHKMMMSMMNIIIKRKPEIERSADDIGFLETYGSTVYFEEQQAITALVHYVSSL